jgi:hypothetical protein
MDWSRFGHATLQMAMAGIKRPIAIAVADKFLFHSKKHG